MRSLDIIKATLGGKMKKLLLITSLALSTTVLAAPVRVNPENQITITTEEITEEEDYVTQKNLIPTTRNDSRSPVRGRVFIDEDEYYRGANDGKPDRIESAGKVISAARDMVALGEAIYELVKKGKPSNVTEYAPISVVPKDPTTKEIIDVFDLEGFSMPVQRTYTTKIKNGVGKVLVNFTYKVMYSYGGSYNGAGKYLTGVIIVPQSVRTNFGWDFNASMKLSGMMNHGTKASPVAGVMITIKYQMNSWSSAFERNDTIHITGRGEFKNHMVQ